MNRFTFAVAAVAVILGTCAYAAPASACQAPTVKPDGTTYYDVDPDVRFVRYVDMTDSIAASVLNRRIAAHPDETRLLMVRGASFAREHQQAQAMADFRAALAQHPHNVNVRWNYGWALFDLGQDACAIQQWQKAAQLKGGHPAWLPSAMALAYWRLGDRQLALQWYNAAAQTYPERWGSEQSIMAETSDANWSDAQRDMFKAMYQRWARNPAFAMTH